MNWRYHPLGLLRRPGWRGVLLGLVSSLLAWGFTRSPLLVNVEEWMQDGCFSFRGKRPSAARVILVGIDDKSLDSLGKLHAEVSPELARAVRYLREKGAAVVGLDVIVPESLAQRELGAEALGQAIVQAGEVVLAEAKFEDRWIRPHPQWRLAEFLAPRPTDLGFVNLTEDDDFFLRRQQLLIRDGDEARMHFALALLARKDRLTVKWDDGSLRLGDDQIPLDEEQKLRINYRGPPGTFPSMRFSAVLDAEQKKHSLPLDPYGAIVIIGATARSQQDYHATPFTNNYWRSLLGDPAGLMSGSEIHANIVATLADRAYIRILPPWLSFGLLLGVGALLGHAFARLNLAWGLVLAFAHHWGWKGLALVSFSYLGLRLDIVPMLVLGVLAYGVTFLSRWWTLRRMLGVVKSESIARMLENEPGHLDLRGEERTVTGLFADIRNFTNLSAKHSAREVVALLNAYFGSVVPIIEEHGGTLNQYMGDGIMVVFGAPGPLPEHALQAVRAAVAMVRRVHDLRGRWAELDFPGLRIGVGIHTGPVVVGTVGSPRRLDWTAIGDTVNTASRIESKNKDFGTEILISADTHRDLPAKERVPLGCCAEPVQATVKGKGQQLWLHRVCTAAERAAPAEAAPLSSVVTEPPLSG